MNIQDMTPEQRLVERNRLRRNAVGSDFQQFVEQCLYSIEENINARFPNAVSSDSLQRMVGGRQAVNQLRCILFNLEAEPEVGEDSEPQEKSNG